MEIFVSAVLGELATRSINFVISRSSKPKVADVESSLQRALLRAQVIIDEATDRRITNQAMLQQLEMLKDAMYKGCYILDTLKYQSQDEEDAKDHVVSYSSFFLSKVNSLKGTRSANRKMHILEQLQDALDNLSSMIINVKELVVFLTRYPCMYHQPYSMHLLLGNCMFSRQMEAELVRNFLLCTQPNGAEELEVLPVVGPGRVGKSTLVAHVCNDERVRAHFSEIMFLSNHDFKDEKVITSLWEGCVKKYHNSRSSKYGRILVVVEMAGDFNEDDWKRFYAASKRYMTSSASKIIITSRSDKITKLGTTRAVTLKYMTHEAYWYFLKTLTFGSNDPMMHPRMENLAMEISRMLKRAVFNSMDIICLLRDNFDIHFWCKVVTFLRGFTKWYASKFGEPPFDALMQNRPACLWRMLSTSQQIMVYHQYECSSSQQEGPKLEVRSVMYGGVKPSGRFEAVAWRSPIPPYYNYIYSCEVRDLKTTSAKRKRS
ncbi:disease resistance protein RGA2-like [Panicum virgatum]|nr:disease resistance protein RGA2-like [Panicum virgatum]